MLQIQSTYFSVHFQYAFLKYVAYLQSTYLKEKIRIGYVLKSAEVRTLVSRRYSENSSHTQSHLPEQTHYTSIHTPKDTNTHLLTKAYPGILGPSTHPDTPGHTSEQPRTPPHSCTHPQTPLRTPYIPAHALNVINYEIIHK